MTRDDWNHAFKAEAANLLNYLVFRTRDRDRAEELYAKTVELAWRKRRSFQPSRGSIGAWLIGISRRVYADEVRYRYQYQAAEQLCDLPDERSLSPERGLIRESEASAVRAAIANLPERQKDVVAMKWGAGMTNRDIAQVLEISESNVGTIAARAVQGLRSLLDKEEWFDVD